MCEFLFYYGTRVSVDLIKKRYAGYSRENDGGRGLVDDNYDKTIAACFGWPIKKGSTDYEQPKEYDASNYTFKKNKGWICLDTQRSLEALGEYADKFDFYGLPLVSTMGLDGFDIVPLEGTPLPDAQAPKRVVPHTAEQGDKYILSLIARTLPLAAREGVTKGTTNPTLAQWMQPELNNGFEPKKYRLPIVSFFAVQKGYAPLNRPVEIVQPSRARAKAALARPADGSDGGEEEESKQPRSSEDQRSPSHLDEEDDMVVDDH
jgi:hypothetical protein